MIKRIIAFIKELGYESAKIVLKSDQESSMKSVIDAVIRARSDAPTMPECQKNHESQLCRASDNKLGVLQHVTFSFLFRTQSQQPGGHVTALFGYRRLFG